MHSLNFNQVIHYYNLKPHFNADFCKYYIYNNHHFALFNLSDLGVIKCLYLNNRELIAANTLFYFLSPRFEMVADLKKNIVDRAEIISFKTPIDQPKLTNFLYGLKQLQPVLWSESAFNILSHEVFKRFYRTDTLLFDDQTFSLVLSTPKEKVADICDFNNKGFSYRFSNSLAYWTSEYFSNCRNPILSFNPLNFLTHFSSHDPLDFYSICLSPNVNPSTFNVMRGLLSNRNLLFPLQGESQSVTDTKLTILYSDNFNENIALLKLVYFHCLCVSHAKVSLNITNNSIDLSFWLPKDTDVLPFIQFGSDAQSSVRNLFTEENNIGSEIPLNIQSFTPNLIQMEDSTIVSISGGSKIENIRSLIFCLLSFYQVQSYNLVYCANNF